LEQLRKDNAFLKEELAQAEATASSHASAEQQANKLKQELQDRNVRLPCQPPPTLM
jgi:hypothetical protein